MANNPKKYAGDGTLSALVTKIKELFVKKTDLNTALSNKADKSHTHSISDTTNLQSTLDGKVPTSRTINSKPLSDNVTLSASDVGAAPSTHDHSDKYYEKYEIDTKLSGKSDSTHHHDSDYADINHNHDGVYAVEGHNHDTKYEPKGTAFSTVSTHNTSTSAHGDIRDLITGLTNRLNALANSDDTTLDQMSEIVTYIKNNKSLIDGVTTNKVNVSDIINNLTTNVSNKPLSAAQGVEIKRLIDTLQANIDAFPQSDWSQNDSSQPDYVKNRTHYSTFESATLIDDTVNCASGTSNFSGYCNIEIGKAYTVVFDGTTYECVGFDDGGFKTIGAPYQSYSNYPFCIYNESNKLCIDAQVKATHTVKIIGEVETVHKIDEKYIPDVFLKSTNVIGRVGEGKGAEIFNDYNNNIASGASSHAEGYCTEATGKYSHTEGYMTKAQEQYAHAEGYSNTASGEAAHAEGFSTWADGNSSHTEGCYTTASGDYSHAEGFYVEAAGRYQHVQGKYNIIDEDSSGNPLDTYAHIVGNGSSNSKRSNAHTVDWDGNAWFAGDIYVGGISQNDSDASKVITKADQKWNLLYDSGEIPQIVNSISNIDVSGYTNIQVLVRIYNDGDSVGSRNGSAIFKAQNGKSYQFPVWSNMFSKSINTVYTMATFNLVDGWLVCPCATRLIGDVDMFAETEGGTAGSLVPTGSGMMRCTSPLSTLTISSLDQNSNYYFGMGSRVMVWGWN